ncbi:hypothetical protein VQ02_30305 [Methylobacterium variabile]|jgi:plastocyanin|uniref:EfeO-type cupredoxin-like domain-containing protein n=1 Tax=Methylobacterium variabile TaxID=298794 RepID=A0A0J6S6G4_9HYPH|nr:cupredoxin family copper-binding protein [Methylobacterium variabile]KMO29217.1 hypothetical protein VQ02_30305 [Methylobacterium variabile]
MPSSSQAGPSPAPLLRRGRQAAFAATLIAALLLGAGAAAESPAPAAAVVVRIDNFTFSPAVVAVAPGTTLTWRNGDDIPHTVVATAGQFRSRALDTDESFSFTFSVPGEYPYFCSLHPHMTGTVVVRVPPG